MYHNINKNHFCKQKEWESPQTVFNPLYYKKTAKIFGIFASSCLVTDFCCGHNMRRFARGDCS